MSLARLSLVWKIWLSTSVVLTALFAVTALLLQRQVLETTGRGLEEEVHASFQAYESLWAARAETLGSIAAIVGSIPNVRAAFSTLDRATIRDTTGELWLLLSDRLKESSFFVVTDPEGITRASLDTVTPVPLPREWPLVAAMRDRFPRQVSGFAVYGGQLFQLVLTPVYVDAAQGGQALLNVLVTGYTVNHLVAQRLKESTGGSEFLFVSGGRIFASTLNSRASGVLAARLVPRATTGVVSDGVSEYLYRVRELIGLEGKPVASLGILRSFEAARQRLRALQRWLALAWLAAIAAGLGITWVLARRIVRPVEMLDRAAAEVARQNYDFRVRVSSQDELGRLAATFNSMCESLQAARRELIRQERISTIGRLASSIVHDLRNPLAAIYGGAEMMVDTDLDPAQTRRLGHNIYQASRRIQEMLQDLLQVSRGKSGPRESCKLSEVVLAAVEALEPEARARSVALPVDVPEEIELPLERSRLERVFLNLIGNALEVLPQGGEVRISARVQGGDVLVEVADTGPGISPAIRDQLFQPFVTHGKKSGLGLGLALSRQTVLDHGGDMWVASGEGSGARFHLRLPRTRRDATAGVPVSP